MIATPETDAGALTVTTAVAVFSPSCVFTVMVALPAVTAVTTPFSSTVATPVLSELQPTLRFVAFAGSTVAVSVRLLPVPIVAVAGCTVTSVTATTGAYAILSLNALPLSAMPLAVATTWKW